MSKKAKKAPAARADNPAPVPHFDAKRVWQRTMKYASVTFDTPDGEHFDVMVPYQGRPSKKRQTQAAFEYAQALRRVRDSWREHLTEEQLSPLRENLIKTTAGYFTLQLFAIVSERFGEEGLTALYGPDLEALLEGDRLETKQSAILERAQELQAAALRDAYRDSHDDLDDAIRSIEYDAMTAVLLDFEQEHGDAILSMSEEEYDRLFTEAVDRDYDERRGHYAVTTAEWFAHQMLDGIEAGSIPLDKLLKHLGVIPAAEAELAVPPLDLDRALGMLSMQPAQTIDRAARGPDGWLQAPDRFPRFDDPRSPLFVEYHLESATAEALAEGVNRLNPRTADVWRLVTARSLEAWAPGQDSPPPVWLDVRELAAAMGYKKHHKGGYRPEHLAEIARAVHDLDAFYITLPLGTQVYQPAKAGSKRRAATKLEAVRTYKVLHISAKDEIRNLFGDRYELRYSLKPGEWIALYPRTYAPLLKAIVELPAKAGINTWAKALGTELLYQYRQNAKNGPTTEKLKVCTLLAKAGHLQEATSSRNKSRVRDYFEGALDLLKAEDVCAGWEYEPGDADNLEAKAGTRGWFDTWLECRVLITTPERITTDLQATSDAAKNAQHKRRLSSTR